MQLLPAALDTLKARRKVAADDVIWVFPGVGASGHLIDLKKRWDAFRKRSKLTDVRIHDLRRTCASYLAIAGVSLQQIAASLGHKSMQSTSIYAKLADSAVRDAREVGAAKMISMMAAAKKRRKRSPARGSGPCSRLPRPKNGRYLTRCLLAEFP